MLGASRPYSVCAQGSCRSEEMHSNAPPKLCKEENAIFAKESLLRRERQSIEYLREIMLDDSTYVRAICRH